MLIGVCSFLACLAAAILIYDLRGIWAWTVTKRLLPDVLNIQTETHHGCFRSSAKFLLADLLPSSFQFCYLFGWSIWPESDLRPDLQVLEIYLGGLR